MEPGIAGIEVDQARLLRLLNPRSIAVIGGDEAATVIRQCHKLGYAGALWAVNPTRSQLAGIDCCATIEQLPEAPDAVFIGIPARPTIALVEQLSARGVGGVVCLASGFGEVGAEGQTRQQQLVAAAADMPVLGPNCYGFINTLLGAALFPDQHGLSRTTSGVAILSASGNIAINLTLQQRGLPIGWLVTVGNQAVIGIEEIVAAALDNDQIKAIGLQIEGLRNIPRFIRLAAQARAKQKPIIVLKTGKSALGARITMSHTATLAGDAALYAALFERLGVGFVADLETFLEALKLAWVHGPLPTHRIASMSCSGGEASLIADLSMGTALVFPPVTGAHEKQLKSTLNDYVAIANPLDYHTFIWGDRQRLTATFAAMMAGDYALVLLIIDYPWCNDCDLTDWLATTHAFIDACAETGSRGATVSCLTENYSTEVLELLMTHGIAPLQGMPQALTAIEVLCTIGQHWLQPAAVVLSHAGLGAAPGAAPGPRISEAKAKALLQQHGLPVPRSGLAEDTEQALSIAASLGYPLVLKAVGDDIVHKSEHGGVVLNIRDPASARHAAASLFAISPTLLVEEMVSGVIAELLVGVSYDNQFGHYLIIGYGGTAVELFRDREILFFPLARAQVEAALRRLTSWPLLDGYRGREKADVAAAIDFILQLAELIEQRGADIVELEVNPLLVRARGSGVVAADAVAGVLGGQAPQTPRVAG